MFEFIFGRSHLFEEVNRGDEIARLKSTFSKLVFCLRFLRLFALATTGYSVWVWVKKPARPWSPLVEGDEQPYRPR